MRCVTTVATLAVMTLSCQLDSPDTAYLGQEPVARLVSLGYASSDGEVSDPVASTWAQQKLIRNADMSIRVESIPDALDVVRDIAEKHNGVIANSHVEKTDDGSRRANVVLKIPTESFEATMSDLRNFDDLRRESVTTQDITKEYVDLETRLSVMRQTEQRLRQLLNDSTGSLSEILEVEREIGRVIEAIERLEGERRYYDTRMVVSTITVSLYEPGAGSSPPLFVSISSAFSNALDVLAQSVALVVYLVTFLVPWLLLSILVWFGIRRLRKSRKTVKTIQHDT